MSKLGLSTSIYMSDNGGDGGGGAGGGKGKGGGGRENLRPLTAGKGSVWKGGIRVPLIIRGPGIAANSWCHERVVGCDFFPTLCKLAGVSEALPNNLEGVAHP